MRRPQVVEAGGWYGSHAFHFPNIQTAEANINAGIAAARQTVAFFRDGTDRFRVN